MSRTWTVSCLGTRQSPEVEVTARSIFSRTTSNIAIRFIRWFTAASLPYGVSEIQHAGLTTTPSSVTKPPRITESPASLECVEWGTLQIGGNRLIIGLIKRVHVRDELFDSKAGRIRSEDLHVIGRMASPNWYCRTRDRFEMIRPG